MICSPMPISRDVALVERRPLEGAYVLLTFRHPEVAHEARAGQFVMAKAGVSSAPPLRRPFSVMATDAPNDTFTLFVKSVGSGSGALADMQPGDVAQILGPLGRPFDVPGEEREVIMVAGGYGIAPFHLLTDELHRAGRRGRLFYGGRSSIDLQVREGFQERGVSVSLSTDDGSLGHKGRVTEPLEKHLDVSPAGTATLLACGPDPMLHAVARVAARRNLPAQVSLDPWMGCGVGTCLGCVVWMQAAHQERPKYRCACTEGPVFDALEVVWRGEQESEARRRDMGA
jgi:dihydroorotate dehydrogenase electron transfer subunit